MVKRYHWSNDKDFLEENENGALVLASDYRSLEIVLRGIADEKHMDAAALSSWARDAVEQYSTPQKRA
jgi:hypothetical protein